MSRNPLRISRVKVSEGHLKLDSPTVLMKKLDDTVMKKHDDTH